MKPAIAYTLSPRYSFRTGGLRVFAITTRKGQLLYGRWQEDSSTSARSMRDCYGRFATAEEAEAARGGLQAILDRDSERKREIAQMRAKAHEDFLEARDAYLKQVRAGRLDRL